MEAAESLAGSSDPGTALEDADRRQLGQSADQQPEGDLPVLDAADGGEDPDDAVDFSKREERIGERRAAAMQEIWSSKGLSGALALLSSSNAPDTVGIFASRCVLGFRSETAGGSVW